MKAALIIFPILFVIGCVTMLKPIGPPMPSQLTTKRGVQSGEAVIPPDIRARATNHVDRLKGYKITWDLWPGETYVVENSYDSAHWSNFITNDTGVVTGLLSHPIEFFRVRYL